MQNYIDIDDYLAFVEKSCHSGDWAIHPLITMPIRLSLWLRGQHSNSGSTYAQPRNVATIHPELDLTQTGQA